MEDQVSVRQSVEGRKVEIWLSPDHVESLLKGETVQLTKADGLTWEDDLEARNSQGEPFSLAEIFIRGTVFGSQYSE